jgi:FkbM family methyltransferase
MNKFEKLFSLFSNQFIEKKDYIDRAYDLHHILQDYAEWISKTNISEITIKDNTVLTTFRDSGIRMKRPKGDKRTASLETLNFKNYEQDELDMQLKLINDNDNVFDIGANLGWFSLQISRFKSSTKVFAFEPIIDTYNTLVYNILINNFKNIIPYNFGFSRESGLFDFFIDSNLSVNASLANVTGSDSVAKIQCFTKNFDEFVHSNSLKVDFIKCDVEGAEYLVFLGATEVLKEQKPIIFTEMLRKWSKKFNYHPNDMILFFKELHYQCFIIKNNKLCEFDIVDQSTVETNYFFLHLTHHKSIILKYN